MPQRSFVAAALVALTIAGCGSPAPSASQGPDGPCTADLPLRTSPTDYPLAVLYVAGDDLPPVVGAVEWLGDAEPVRFEPPRPIHLERFTVLQTEGQAEISLRMSDGVRIARWQVDAVPDGLFRSGDLETDLIRWAEGSDPADVVCIPIRDGDWGIIADVTFADDGGHGTYYWRLNVTETPGT